MATDKIKPVYKVAANGTDITGKINGRLISMDIVDKAGVKSDSVTITIDDRDQLLTIPSRGAKLQVWIGWAGGTLVSKGKFTVDEVEIEGPERQMIIRANAADMNSGIKAPKERSFDNITFGDLVKTIAKDNGLTPSIPADLAARNLGHVDQTESDLQLLTRICAEQGATFKIADKRLVVADRASGKTASGKTLPMMPLNSGNCEGWTATISERDKYRSVVAQYHDHDSADLLEVTAGEGDPSLTLKNTYKDEETAKHAARSKLAALNRGALSVSIRGYIGNPNMIAEQLAVLSGFRAGVDGQELVIDQVTHSISDSGYTCGIELETKE